MKLALRIPANKSRRPTRNGVSLAEMMVVMTIMTAVLTVGMNGLFRLFRAQASEVQALSEASVWRRLSRDFRADVHSAATATSPESNRLELATTSGLIVWSSADGVLQRHIQPPVEGETSPDAVEHYRLPDAEFTLGLTPPEEGQPDIASVVIKRAGDPHTRPTSGRIEATPGLSLRYAQQASNGDAP